MTDRWTQLERLCDAATTRLASGEWRADAYGLTQIWGDSLKGGDTMLAQVRGWGYLTGGGSGALGLSEEDGMAAQKAWGDFIAAANPSAIKELIAAARAGAGWQPIETAPKDGTEFQGWVGQWEPRCRFNPESETFETWGRVDYDEDGWDVFVPATHWMPPPDPPSDTGAGEGE
jgi:hypothetical protein